jgi:hypothetical protein
MFPVCDSYRWHDDVFEPDQAAGLSKLALSFALSATLFVSMTGIRKDPLLQTPRGKLCQLTDVETILGTTDDVTLPPLDNF